MKTRLTHFLAGGALLFTVGCSSSGDVTNGSIATNGPLAGSNRSLTIVEPDFATLQRDGDLVNALEVEAFDASGERVLGPVDIPISQRNVVNDIPPTATTIQIDYLRNSGFMLFRAEVPYTGQAEIQDPRQEALPYHNTTWKVSAQGQGFGVSEIHHGPGHNATGARAKEGDQTPFRVKGVCYSPTPINDSNKDAPQNGDLFWDSFKTLQGNNNIYGWNALWASFYAQGIGTDGNSRADLEKIVALGANTVRLYAAHAVHLGNKGEFHKPTDPNYHLFTHKEFLDACYNGNRKGKTLRVIADIPMPDFCFNLQTYNNLKNAGVAVDEQIAWWEDSFRKSVTELCQHPAVLGINIMNEQDGPFSHPGGGNGPDNAQSQYFWAQSKKYADLAKEICRTTPGGKEKLVGWAFHDSPDLVVFGSRFPESGPKYLEQMTSFDYWGVNSYQTVNLDSLTGLPADRFRGSYAGLSGAMKKPLLLTELGWPATGHNPDTPDGQIYDDPTTHQKVADTIKLMFPQVFASDLYMGACYFEFCDEWWKQSGFSNSEWNGGNSTQKGQSSMPNGWNDEEGFGLYGVGRQGNRPNNDRNYITFGPNPDAEFGDKGPKQPYDKLIPRPKVVDALKAVFNSVP